MPHGTDCALEVPIYRWDHTLFYNPDPMNAGTVYTKHGGVGARTPQGDDNALHWGASSGTAAGSASVAGNYSPGHSVNSSQFLEGKWEFPGEN